MRYSSNKLTSKSSKKENIPLAHCASQRVVSRVLVFFPGWDLENAFAPVLVGTIACDSIRKTPSALAGYQGKCSTCLQMITRLLFCLSQITEASQSRRYYKRGETCWLWCRSNVTKSDIIDRGGCKSSCWREVGCRGVPTRSI